MTRSCLAPRQLYRYYHEAQPQAMVLPAVPEWKAGDSPDRGDEAQVEKEADSDGMEHDDVLGEEVCPSS